MLKNLKHIFSPLLWFYALVVYVFAMSVWWINLHLRNNRDLYRLNVELLEMEGEKRGKTPQTIRSTPQYAHIEQHFASQRTMILSEGAVFLLILSLGVYRIHGAFKKELSLNHQQRNFLLSITHELKSPLAALKLVVQTLLNRQLEPEKQKKLLHNALNDTDRLHELVENLLLAAKLESQSASFSLQPLCISDLLQALFDEFSEKYENLRRFESRIETDVWLHADPLALQSLCMNLLDNALKYSRQGDTISCVLFTKGNELHWEVADSGIGIAATDKKKVFEKFYRVGNEDTRSTKGTGLGLFIVRELVHMMRGSISIKDNKPRGTVFLLVFPVSDNTSVAAYNLIV